MSRASGIGQFVAADGGRAKASVHHDSQSNDGEGSGKGSETVCFLGPQSDPRGFLAAGSSEFASDRRLFRGRGREGEEEVVDREGEWEAKEVGSGKIALNEVSLNTLPKQKTKLLTIDVYEARENLGVIRMEALKRIASSSAKVEKPHGRRARSRWNL
jgi:hypothetical protein